MADARQLAVAIIDDEDDSEGGDGDRIPFHKRLIPKAKARIPAGWRGPKGTSHYPPPPMLVAPVASRKRAQLELDSFEPRARSMGVGGGVGMGTGSMGSMGRMGTGDADTGIGRRTMFLSRGDDLLVEFAKTVSRFSKSSSTPPSLAELTYVVQLANSVYRKRLGDKSAVSRLPVLVHWVGVVMERAGATLTPTMIASLITESAAPAPPRPEGVEGAEGVETMAQLYNHLHRSLSLPLTATGHSGEEETAQDDEDLAALLKEMRLS